MEVFNLTLTQMLNMFFLIIVGFILKRAKILPDNSDTTISRLQTYALVPALNLINQAKKCTVESFMGNSHLLLYGLILVVVAIGISYPLSLLFAKKSKDAKEIYQRQIYKYSLAFGNYGYVGNFLVLGIWGQDMLFKYLLFTFIPGIFCYAWGMYILIPKSQNSSGILENLKNSLLKPPFVSLVIGMILGLTGIGKYIPSFLDTALTNAGNCMGPLAMILAGVVIGGYNFKEIILFKKIYIVSLLRLIILPAIFVGTLKLINTPTEVILLVLVAFAAPIGMNTIVYPAAFGGDTKTGASMALISSILSVITIPLMFYMFNINI